MVLKVVPSPLDTQPAVFHVTHWKAGSQWVRAVLEAAEPDRIVPVHGSIERLQPSLVQGGVYTPIYASYGQFRARVPHDLAQRTFAVIRDPRDTLVSWYFSLLHSHTPDEPSVLESRQFLSGLNKTDGLAVLICKHLYDVVSIQREWLESGAKVFRYEDLVSDQHETFRQIFEFCGIQIPDSRRTRIVNRQSFSRLTRWRLGRRENIRSHLRKGVVGDWRSHFCDRLKQLFKLHHGQTLIQAGYERDDSW